jgi:general secretion pathway protein D
MTKHRVTLLLAALAIFVLGGCAAQKAYNRAQDEAKRGEWDRAVAHYIEALHKKPDNPQYRVGFERARLAASQFHFQKAKQLTVDKNYEQAVIEYQLALDFDPTNQFIANELKNARIEYEKLQNVVRLTEIEKAKEEAKKKMQIYKVLGPEAETTIQSLKFHDDSLKHILDSLGALAGINIVYDSDFRDQEFSVSLDNITFRNALEQILVANRLYFKPLDQSTILIIPDNPQKRRQYDEQVIQTFYLSNAELNDVLNLIRSVMQIQRIATTAQCDHLKGHTRQNRDCTKNHRSK